VGVNLNELSATAHRLLIKEVPEIRRYLIEIRPQLRLLPNSIDIEADDLLEAKKVNREVLLRRQLKPVLPDFEVILIDTPPAMRAAIHDPRNRAWRKKKLERIVRRIRDRYVGTGCSAIDFLEDVKCACAQEDVEFDNDLYNELVG
jgi:hypothetical protein